MATFKVGQRVRLIRQNPASIARWGNVIGREATVVEVPGWKADCRVLVDGDPVPFNSQFDHLAPLTDPGCESFLQAMRDYANKQRTPVDVLRELHGEYL
jgi:hypothetical protein